MFAFMTLGCTSNDGITEDSNEILIFGWFADASCSGSCSTIYKLENGQVYKDISATYPNNTFFTGNFQLMSNANYDDFKSLLSTLPSEIRNEPNGYLDCTTCTNANGGFYIELKNDTGFHKSWRFRNAVYPNYMENYRSLLVDKLAELSSL